MRGGVPDTRPTTAQANVLLVSPTSGEIASAVACRCCSHFEPRRRQAVLRVPFLRARHAKTTAASRDSDGQPSEGRSTPSVITLRGDDRGDHCRELERSGRVPDTNSHPRKWRVHAHRKYAAPASSRQPPRIARTAHTLVTRDVSRETPSDDAARPTHEPRPPFVSHPPPLRCRVNRTARKRDTEKGTETWA